VLRLGEYACVPFAAGEGEGGGKKIRSTSTVHLLIDLKSEGREGKKKKGDVL